MTEGVYQERVRIPSRHGCLAGELAYALDEAACACLLVNPHPYMGGHMGNNIVAHLATGLAGHGGLTFRFDYSGVGESDGPTIDVASALAQFWETGHSHQDPQMVDDVGRAADWLRRQTNLPLVLVGYSFGAYAATAAVVDDVRGLILISPTVCRHALALSSAVPKLVVYSDNDFATPVAQTEAWLEQLAEPKLAHCVAGGDHFFKGQEDSVLRPCQQFIAGVVMRKEEALCR